MVEGVELIEIVLSVEIECDILLYMVFCLIIKYLCLMESSLFMLMEDV